MRRSTRSGGRRPRSALIEKLGFDRRTSSTLFDGGDADARVDRGGRAEGDRRAARADEARRRRCCAAHRTWLVRRHRGQVQSRRPRSVVGRVGRAAQAAARHARHRRHHGRELSLSRAPRRPAPRRDHRDRFGGAAVRHGLSRSTSSGRSPIPKPTSTRTAASRCGRRSPRRASASRRYFTQRGQLATERALLDDNGDGRDARPAARAPTARPRARLYLDPDVPGAAPTDDVLLTLLQKRAVAAGRTSTT